MGVSRWFPFRQQPQILLRAIFHAMHKLHGMRKNATSSHPPEGNGGVERVNQTLTPVFAMVNRRQDGWDAHLPHVEFS